MARNKKDPGKLLSSAVMLFYFSAFLLIACKDYAWQGFALALAVPAMIWIGTNLLPRLFPSDRLPLSLTNFLCALGVLVLYSTEPEYAYNQAMYYGVGIAAMIVCVWIVRLIRSWRVPVLLLMPVSLVLLTLPLLIGRETNGATNWFYVGNLSVQPSEIVKLSLLLIISYYMSRHRMLPWLGFAVCCLALLMLQKDLGTALIYYATTLFLFYASTGNLPLTGLGLVGAGGAAVLGYAMFAHGKKRVAIWRNPWIYYETSGYQIVQMLMAIASGGLFGVGLGLGAPRVIPVYFTDCIFAVICEQFGVIFGALVLAMYVILILRGVSIASAARSSFHALLAMGATVMLGIQTFIIIGGVLKLIPLTGVTMPFVSYGGTSLVSCMGLIGLIQGVASVNQDDLAYDYEISHTLQEEAMMPEADRE